MFFANTSRYNNNNNKNNFDLRHDCDIRLEGPQGYNEFGYSISTYKNVLAVGAPGYRHSTSVFPTGAIYVYDTTTSSVPKLLGIVEGDEELAEFGSQVAISQHSGIIAVSSPSSGSSYFSSHLRGGRVMTFDLNDIVDVLEKSCIVSVSAIPTISNLEAGEGGLRLSRFGTTVRWLKSDNSLAISAPMWTKGALPLFSKLREAGSVYIWSQDRLPKGMLVCVCVCVYVHSKMNQIYHESTVAQISQVRLRTWKQVVHM